MEELLASAERLVKGLEAAVQGSVDMEALDKQRVALDELCVEARAYSGRLEHDLRRSVSYLERGVFDFEEKGAKRWRECVEGAITNIKGTLFDPQPCGRTDLDQLIMLSFRSYGGLVFEDEGISMESDMELEGRPSVYINGGEFQARVLFNLFQNVGKYGKSLVKCSLVEADGEYLVSVWNDCEQGIPADKLEAIFELGVKLNAEDEGSGFGLANAKEVVEKYGGRIWAESGEDWVRMNFTLPFYLEAGG